MIIEIDDELFDKVKAIVKNRSLKTYKQLEEIEPIESILADNSLTTARTIKTNRVKERITIALEELIKANITPSKYQVHKRTKIAYVTLNKYYDAILEEVQNEC